MPNATVRCEFQLRVGNGRSKLQDAMEAAESRRWAKPQKPQVDGRLNHVGADRTGLSPRAHAQVRCTETLG